MKNHYEQIDLLAAKFNLDAAFNNGITELLDNTLNEQFVFGQEHYSFNSVMPDSLYAALLPYVENGIEINGDAIRLEAVYNSAASTALFEVALTEQGLKTALDAYTNLSFVCGLVFEGDELEIDAASETVKHVRAHKSKQVNGAYCIFSAGDDSWLTTMSNEELLAAFDANIKDRLNGANPYLTASDVHEFYRLSCIRRALKPLAVMSNIKGHEVVQILLALHNAGFDRARQIRKVVMLNQRAFRGINSNEVSPIEDIYNRAQSAVIHEFKPTQLPVKTVKLERTALVNVLPDWGLTEFGVCGL